MEIINFITDGVVCLRSSIRVIKLRIKLRLFYNQLKVPFSIFKFANFYCFAFLCS